MARANETLARAEQVKAFRILPRELDPEQEGESVSAAMRRSSSSAYMDSNRSRWRSASRRRFTFRVGVPS